MNSALPDDIYVKEVQQVDDHFHCRYDCQASDIVIKYIKQRIVIL